jgi:hypothetical protein
LLAMIQHRLGRWDEALKRARVEPCAYPGRVNLRASVPPALVVRTRETAGQRGLTASALIMLADCTLRICSWMTFPFNAAPVGGQDVQLLAPC